MTGHKWGNLKWPSGARRTNDCMGMRIRRLEWDRDTHRAERDECSDLLKGRVAGLLEGLRVPEGLQMEPCGEVYLQVVPPSVEEAAKSLAPAVASHAAARQSKALVVSNDPRQVIDGEPRDGALNAFLEHGHHSLAPTIHQSEETGIRNHPLVETLPVEFVATTVARMAVLTHDDGEADGSVLGIVGGIEKVVERMGVATPEFDAVKQVRSTKADRRRGGANPPPRGARFCGRSDRRRPGSWRRRDRLTMT